MKNKLIDLNNHLFEALERLNDEDLTPDELDAEIKRAKVLTGIGNAIISNASLALDVEKHKMEYAYSDRKHKMPEMLISRAEDYES